MKELRATVIAALGLYLVATPAFGFTSPYAQSVSSVPLNQSSTDDINGLLVTSSHPVTQGDLSWLTDANSSSQPSLSVLIDDATVDLSWDLGTALDPANRRLNTVSVWVEADPNRSSFIASLSTSLDGISYTPIDNSTQMVLFSTPAAAENEGSVQLFHNLTYDFTGTNVSNFQYVRLTTSTNSPFPFTLSQPRLVEVDITTSVVPEPSTLALLTGGVAIVGVAMRRRRARA